VGTYVKTFDFSSAGDYTLSGHAAIASGSLSLGNSVHKLSNAQRRWEHEWPVDGNFNMVGSTGTVYNSHDGSAVSSAFNVKDGQFIFWAKYTGALTNNKALSVYCRYDELLGSQVKAEFVSRADNTPDVEVTLADTNLDLQEIYWHNDAIQDMWRQYRVTIVGTVLRVQMGAQRDVWHRKIARDTEGMFALTTSDTTGLWVLGGDDGQVGHPSPHVCPYIGVRRQGACELATAAVWTLPEGCSGLVHIDPAITKAWCPDHDDEWASDGTFRFPYNMQYRINGGNWTDIPIDGALGGIGTAGDSFWWRFNDGNGTGFDTAMDNVLYNDAQLCYVPVAHEVRIAYTGEGNTSVSSFARRNVAQFGRRG